jgi:hypothetical protein
MQKSTSLFFLLLLVLSCKNSDKSEFQLLTEEEKTKIESLSHRLITSINEFDFSVVNNHWSNEAFKERVSNITGTQKSVFEHIFEKDLKRTIKVGNLSIIHLINSNQGKASFLKLEHLKDHSELTLLLTFNSSFNFLKYRFQIVKGKPALCDFYQFADNLWYSEKIINSLRLASKSEERLILGDTLEALNYLYDIPESHQTGNWLTFKKLNLAQSLGDTIYSSVLVTEFENNKSLYVKYLYHLYFSDSSDLETVYSILSKEIGESVTLDSLISSRSYWE